MADLGSKNKYIGYLLLYSFLLKHNSTTNSGISKSLINKIFHKVAIETDYKRYDFYDAGKGMEEFSRTLFDEIDYMAHEFGGNLIDKWSSPYIMDGNVIMAKYYGINKNGKEVFKGKSDKEIAELIADNDNVDKKTVKEAINIIKVFLR